MNHPAHPLIERSGYVALIGRPNVGKSTLLNASLGEKISIISPKPQTTRTQILGIKIFQHSQIVYIDTPGLHREEKKAINRYMNRVASSAIPDADVIVFIIESTGWRQGDELVLKKLRNAQQPVILVINKIDLLSNKSAILPLIEKLSPLFPFRHIIPLSALNTENILALEQTIATLLPEGGMIYPEDQLTDKSLRFLAAEMIREKLILATEEELPYATTVEIEQFKEEQKITTISAIIWVERAGQKAIIIGKKGACLKKIGTQARRELEALLGTKVFLRLWVKIKEHWSDDDKALHSLGFE